jgi:hypothetical protein
VEQDGPVSGWRVIWPDSGWLPIEGLYSLWPAKPRTSIGCILAVTDDYDSWDNVYTGMINATKIRLLPPKA